MKRKLLFILNPISGTKSKDSVKETIQAKTMEAGIPFIIYPSVANGDYRFLHPVLQEEKITDVIIAAGDGTINQVVQELHSFNVQFGIIPCGSGNGLAFTASIPKNTSKALEIIFEGRSKWTDAFMVNDSFACMLCGLGFDAKVAHDFANDPNRGLYTYIKKTISNFISAKTYPFTLAIKNKKIKSEAFFISIANSNQFGNHFTIAPKALLTDGLIDVVVMTKQSKLSVLYQAIKQVSGYNELQEFDMVDEKASIIYFQTDELSIHNPLLAPLHIDGDPAETAKRINITSIKKAFRLIYPNKK